MKKLDIFIKASTNNADSIIVDSAITVTSQEKH
jgi:hypothetical protein